MAVQINGTALNPEPKVKVHSVAASGGKLDGTDALGAYDIIELTAGLTRGGTANFNWTDFENSVLTSIAIPAKNDTLSGSNVTYNSGVVSRSISTSSKVGDLIDRVSMVIRVVI